MKIAIRSKDGKTVSDSVKSFTGYLIYELTGEKFVKSEFRKCTSVDSKDASTIGDCQAVISKAISPDEKESLRKKGKDVLITFKTSPEDALRSFMRQKLYFNNYLH